MAYPRPPLDGRNPPDLGSERSRPSWEPQHYYSSYVPIHERPPQRPSTSNMATADPMDPETSDSDVSVTVGENYQYTSPTSTPASLPPPPSKHALESSDAVQARLRELSRVEDHNIKKHELLMAKRRRKDERITRKREIQDRKIRSIMDARARRDTRVIARREREDAAFKRFDQQLEEEEMNLHRRLKRLKRGLPIEESPLIGTRSISSTSMSPPGPTFSTIPPPAKRHQAGPPGQSDSLSSGLPPPLPPPQQQQQQLPPSLLPPPPPPPQHGSHPMPPQNGPPAPQYSFYQPNIQPYNMPYHPPPPPLQNQYGPPPNHSPSAPSTGPPRNDHGHNDRPGFHMNGRPPSPISRPPQPIGPTQTSNPNNPPPRQATSNYDTRPPPTTTSSGFASINTPQSSGFATINAKSASPAGLGKPIDSDPSRTPGNGPMMDYGVNNHRMYGYAATPTTTPGPPIPTSTGKRTPSTTHPYQMSEAFANRHHHCERVDGLNRGIWTSYGPMGTQDAPTGPAIEMYLRCDHDNCRRIDWRTVHGLQCHIVKNHDQPKGTIGSLEKALDKYGVPVREVEDYEREHGEGTAGTMADPKNLKIKNKTKEAAMGRGSWRRSTPSSYSVDPTARPAGYKPESNPNLDSPTIPNSTGRSPTSSVAAASGYMQDDIALSDEEGDDPRPRNPASAKSANRFEAVKGEWDSPVNYSTPSKEGVQGGPTASSDVEMQNVPAMQLSSAIGPARSDVFNASYAGQNNRVSNQPLVDDQIETKQMPKENVDNQTADSTNPSVNGIANSNHDQKVEEVGSRSRNSSMSNVKGVQDRDTPMTGVIEDNKVNGREIETEADVKRESEHVEQFKDHLVNGDMEQQEESTRRIDQESGVEIEADTSTKEVKTPALPPPPPPPPPPPTTTTSRRSTLQSPIMTNKALPSPVSTKRGSRRSSTARKMSVDGVDVDMLQSPMAEREKENKDKEDDMDGDSITVAASNPPPHNTEYEQVKDGDKESSMGIGERVAATGGRTPPRRLRMDDYFEKVEDELKVKHEIWRCCEDG